ncbi:helix-turn-helix domain-containing protein [Amnibacterium kyonggiense]
MKTNTLISADEPHVAAVTRRKARTRVTGRLSARVVELYMSGLSTRAVAEELGIGRTTVLSVLTNEGVTLRPRGGHSRSS